MERTGWLVPVLDERFQRRCSSGHFLPRSHRISVTLTRRTSLHTARTSPPQKERRRAKSSEEKQFAPSLSSPLRARFVWTFSTLRRRRPLTRIRNGGGRIRRGENCFFPCGDPSSSDALSTLLDDVEWGGKDDVMREIDPGGGEKMGELATDFLATYTELYTSSHDYRTLLPISPLAAIARPSSALLPTSPSHSNRVRQPLPVPPSSLLVLLRLP